VREAQPGSVLFDLTCKFCKMASASTSNPAELQEQEIEILSSIYGEELIELPKVGANMLQNAEFVVHLVRIVLLRFGEKDASRYG